MEFVVRDLRTMCMLSAEGEATLPEVFLTNRIELGQEFCLTCVEDLDG